VATWHYRVDTYRPDPDIAKDPQVLAERMAYEERKHDGLPVERERVWFGDN
jgi:hypothetical protein